MFLLLLRHFLSHVNTYSLSRLKRCQLVVLIILNNPMSQEEENSKLKITFEPSDNFGGGNGGKDGKMIVDRIGNEEEKLIEEIIEKYDKKYEWDEWSSEVLKEFAREIYRSGFGVCEKLIPNEIIGSIIEESHGFNVAIREVKSLIEEEKKKL